MNLVKIVLFVWALTFVWGIFAATLRKNVKYAFRIANKDYPWWWTFLGFLIIFDLLGFLYVVGWLLFGR